MGGGLRPVAALFFVVVAASALAGCAQASGGTPAATAGTADTGKRCGTAHTAAGVPVEVEVERGSLGCQEALAIENQYSRELASGRVPGNGGGAPVKIRGWVCQGFNTPEVLKTGHTSACKKGGMEILAVLPSPSPQPTSS